MVNHTCNQSGGWYDRSIELKTQHKTLLTRSCVYDTAGHVSTHCFNNRLYEYVSTRCDECTIMHYWCAACIRVEARETTTPVDDDCS